MKLVDKISVEPLDDDRLVNLERRVVANAVVGTPVRGLSRGFLAFAAIAAAAMIAVVVGWKLRGDANGRGREDVGQVAAVEPAPVLVHTGEQASVVDIGDATIQTSPGTELSITRPAGGVLVAMAHGKVELQVGKRGSRPPLVVHAGDTDVEVVGTHFVVEHERDDGIVEVRVTEGIVKVTRAHVEVRVIAGSAWRSDTGVVETIALLDARDAAEAKSSAPEIEIDTHVKDLLHDRVAAVPSHREAPKPSADGSAAATLSTGAKHTLDDPHDPHYEIKSTLRSSAITAMVLDVGTSDPDKAMALYRELLSKDAATASKATYSMAVVQHLKLGRDADALATLDSYMRRFTPKYAEYPSALWLRVRILCLHEVNESCRAAANSYLEKVPGGPMAHEAELITLTQ